MKIFKQKPRIMIAMVKSVTKQRFPQFWVKTTSTFLRGNVKQHCGNIASEESGLISQTDRRTIALIELFVPRL